MRRLPHILIGFFSVFSASLFAQQQQWLDRSWDIFGENMDSAVILCKKAYDISLEKGDLKSMGRALSYRAIYYDIESKSDSAFFLFTKALHIQESLHDTTNLVTTYNNLGIFYFSQYQYPLAISYYQKAYDQALLIHDFSSAAGSLVNIGIIESYKENSGNALEYYAQAERLYMINNDTIALAPIWNNTAKIYYERKDYARALALMEKASKYSDDDHYLHSMITDRVLMANILNGMKNYSEAEKYGLKALELANTGHVPERKQYVYDALAQLYYNMGQYKTAFDYIQKYRDLRDTLINEERASQMARLESLYQLEKKNNQIDKLLLDQERSKNVALQHDKLQSRFYLILIACMVGGILLVILVVLIILLLNNLRLEKQNTVLLSEKNEYAGYLLEKEKLLMKESHHRIKNNLQLINSILDLQARNMKDPAAKEALKESRQRIQSISFAHHHLYAKDTVEKINLKDFITELITSIKESGMETGSRIHIQAQLAEVFTTTDIAIPIGLIVNELFTNALKYAFTGKTEGQIRIALVQQESRILLIIEDDGRGMSENVQNGFGHKLLQSMIRQLKATYTLSSVNGVQHEIDIPYQPGKSL